MMFRADLRSRERHAFMSFALHADHRSHVRAHVPTSACLASSSFVSWPFGAHARASREALAFPIHSLPEPHFATVATKCARTPFESSLRASASMPGSAFIFRRPRISGTGQCSRFGDRPSVLTMRRASGQRIAPLYSDRAGRTSRCPLRDLTSRRARFLVAHASSKP
jgi:hypothetical protein